MENYRLAKSSPPTVQWEYNDLNTQSKSKRQQDILSNIFSLQ